MTYDRDSNSRQQDLCGSRDTCYVGEYTEVWGQPEAWLWWGIKGNMGRPEVLQTQFAGKDGSLPRPAMGFPGPVSDVPNQMNRFIGQGNQIVGDPRIPSGIPGPAFGGPGPMFDQPPWLGILSMEPIGGVAPFPRFRRSIDNDRNKSEKSENNNYFNTYHRLRSPFSESILEPSPTPVFTDSPPLLEQRHETDKQHTDQMQGVDVDQTVDGNMESSRIRGNSLEPQRIRASASTNDEPTEKTKTEKNKESENLDLDETWLTSQLPVLGYPVVLGFDPWMFGGYPNWGLLGRKKREDDGTSSEESATLQQNATDVNAEGENVTAENVNRTGDGGDFEEWASTMPSPPGFGMLPWDFWLAWSFDNAMWDAMRLLHELNTHTSNETTNSDTETDGAQHFRSEPMPLLDENVGSNESGLAEEGYRNRKIRSSESKAPDEEVKEAKESVNNTKDHDKRFAQIPGSRNGFSWPFFPNRGRPQYIPVFARYLPIVISPPKGYRMWPNFGSINSFSNPWHNPLFPPYPWSNVNGQFGAWDNTFKINRFRREVEGDTAESTDTEGEREQRSQEADSSRRESSQGDVNSGGDASDSVWRSASRKYATKENWEQQGNIATDNRYDYTSGGVENQNAPTQERPAQPGWLKNIISGTGDIWNNAEFQQYRNMWDPTNVQPYDGNVLKHHMWNNIVPSALSPGSVWPHLDEAFGGSMFPNHGGINAFGGIDPREGYPAWVDPWQDSFGGSPRNWFSLRDTSRNFKDLNSLLQLWYGRFSREADSNATTESQSKNKNETVKEENRQKRDALSEEQIREKRWEQEFSGTDSPFSSFQQLPSWGAWCKVYWKVVRHKRNPEKSDNANSENIIKRSSAAKGAKEKRWNEWNDNQQGANWMSTFLDLVCPLVLHSSENYDWQDGVAGSSPDVANQYLQFRNKREAETGDSISGDSTTGNSQVTRLERWWNSHSDDYDCLEWISSISAWSPWKGWNLLRSSRENAAVRTDSNEEHTADTQIRSYDSKDGRAVKCREWYRKYRESNRKIRDENSKDDNVDFEDDSNLQIDGVHRDNVHNAGENSDNSDSKVRHRREAAESDRLKRQRQINLQPSWVSPYSSNQPWNKHRYPYSHYHQNTMPWFGPDMYSSLSYESRRNNPFEFIRGLRHSDAGAEGADHASQQRQKRSNEDSSRGKRFFSSGNGAFGFDWTDQSRWYDNGNQWGWPMNSYNRPPMYTMFTDFQIPQSKSPIQNWIRQQRKVGSVGQSDDGKQSTEDGGMGKKKRASLLTRFQEGGGLENSNAHPWLGDFKQQTNPGFWNDYSWMIGRHRRDTKVGTDAGRDRRFAAWGNLIPSTWNGLMQQSIGPFTDPSASHPHNQFNLWRYSRDVDSQKPQDVKQIKEREVKENSKTKRQLSSPAFYPMSQGANWGRHWGYGNIVPLYYNYWGGFPKMYYNGWYRPEALWRAMRFTRQSDDSGKVDENDTMSQNEDLSRVKRWDNTYYNSKAFKNDWNRGFGSDTYDTFHPNQWEGINNWNTRSFYRRSEKQDVTRSKRSTSESNKEKRWFGHQSTPQAPTPSWWQLPFPNAAQSYPSGHQNPLMASLYPQRGFDWQRSSTYPWSESWKFYQRGPYGRNDDFPSHTQLWGGSWDFDRFPRKSSDQGESRVKRDAEHDAKMKRWIGAPSYTSSQHDQFASSSYPQWGFNWQQSNMYPWSDSWKPFQRGSYGRNEDFPSRTQFWEGSMDFQRYPRHSKEQAESRMKRDTKQDTKTKRWQPWGNTRFHLNNDQNLYSSGGFGNNEWMPGVNRRADDFWNSVRYRREAEKNVKEQNVQDGNVNKRWLMSEQYQWPKSGQNQWPVNEQYPWPMNEQYQWSINDQYQWPTNAQQQWPINRQYQWPMNYRWYPNNYSNNQWGKGNWDYLRYPRKTMKDNAKLKKRSAEAWDLNRSWQSGGSGPWTMDPHGSQYSPSWAEWRQPGWNNVWNHGRYRRSVDKSEPTKSKRWQQSADIPWSNGYGQSLWNHQGPMNPWNRGLGNRFVFGGESWRPAGGFQWNWPNDAILGRGFSGYGNMWRYPRQTDDLTDKDDGNRQKREAVYSDRDKRWQRWNTDQFLNWDHWPMGATYMDSWYSSPTVNPSFNARSFFKRATNESKSDHESIDDDQEKRTKRWQFGPAFPTYREDSYPFANINPFGFFTGWSNSFRPTFGPHFYRDARQADNEGPSKLTNEDIARKKRSYGDNYGPLAFPNPLSSGMGFPTMNTHPWVTGNRWWDRNWNSHRYRRSAVDNSEDGQENVDYDRNKRQTYWDNIYGNSWGSMTGFPTFANSWTSNNNLLDSRWNSRRYRRSTEDIGDKNKEKVDSDGRNKRQNYWDNLYRNSLDRGNTDWSFLRYRRSTDSIAEESKETDDSGVRNKRQQNWDNNYGNSWISRREFPTIVGNPWIRQSDNNLYGSNWNSQRYRRSAGSMGEENKGYVDNNSRNKRQNYWDNVYENTWGSEMGFPIFTNPGIISNSWWDSNLNPRRYRRSIDGIPKENKENLESGVRNKRQNYWDNNYGNRGSSGPEFPTQFANPWTWKVSWGNTDWNLRRYRRNTDGIMEENRVHVDSDVRNKRQNYWDSNYGNFWNRGMGFPTFTNPWTWRDSWGNTDWNFRRYRRSMDDIKEKNKENVDSGVRNKRQNYWGNVYGNGWSSAERFPATFANPWTPSNNWWDSNWNTHRYRRSADVITKENKESADLENSDLRNKRQNNWDNNYGKSWSTGTGFPTQFANPWNWKDNWGNTDWNFGRNRRNTDGITEEDKEIVDPDVRSKRQQPWGNVYENGWSNGGRFPATFANPWTASNNWWDSSWSSRRYRRHADDVENLSQEEPDSGDRNKRQHYWNNAFGQNWKRNWLSPNWPLGGAYPYQTVFFLSPFMGSWIPNFGHNGFWNRNWNQPLGRYFRDTIKAQENTTSEDGDTPPNKRSLNFGFIDPNSWNSNDYFPSAEDNAQRKFWNPYYGTYNGFPVSGHRFYRNTEAENVSDGKKRLKREADDMSRVKRFGNQFWDYQNYPMYYANNWSQDPTFDTTNWFSPISPWYMALRTAQFSNPWNTRFLFAVLRSLRQAKGADVNETVERERRDAESKSKEPRQAHWFNFYDGPFGYDSFQRDNPFWGMPFGFRNPISRGQNLYTPGNPWSSWGSGMVPTRFEWIRRMRETDNRKDEQVRTKREAWARHISQNAFGNGWPYGSNWNNQSYDGIDAVNSWWPEKRQFWNTHRPGLFGQQWRNSPSSQWDNRFGSYSPLNSKRDSENTQGVTQDNGAARIKRDVKNVNSQRNKRWWRDNTAGYLNPQYRTRAEWQLGFGNSYPWYPERGGGFWGDRMRGLQFRRKRDASFEDPLKNKRWAPFDSQRDAFSRYGWGNARTNQWRFPSWYSGQGEQSFNQQNPIYPRWGTTGNQGSPYWNGLASYRKRRSQRDPAGLSSPGFGSLDFPEKDASARRAD